MAEQNRSAKPVTANKPVTTKKLDRLFLSVYNGFSFIGRFFREVWKPPYEGKEILRQCYEIGYKSLGLITLTAFITGIVFTKQSRPSLAEFGATSWLPSLVAIAMIRALAPLVTALICAGKVGSGLGAELGSMRVTEQIDAMEVSAVHPFKYLVVSRVIATTIAVPLLAAYTAFVGLMGSYVDVHFSEQSSLRLFFQNAFQSITFLDLLSSLVKSVVYGFTIGLVCCYQGFYASQGTQGVGKASNTAVVLSMFLIFVEEIVIVQIFNGLRPAP
jgi:phospholipid/cholesterol/gamma-HCH transport system permease protein